MGNITVLNKYVCDDPDAFYIGRGSPLGNPYRLEVYGRNDCISKFKTWLEDQVEAGNMNVIEALDQIANQVIKTGHAKLKCFCKPKACHGDVIKALVLKTIQEMNQ